MKHITYNILNKRNGLTLIELIIVMALIAILTTALWGNFFTSLYKGKDSRRKQDLDVISKALDIYYADNKVYPTVFPGPATPFVNSSDSTVIYMQKVPADPSYPNSTYCYLSTNGQDYRLYANLENKSDPKAFPTPVACNSVYYNYGIASPNTTP